MTVPDDPLRTSHTEIGHEPGPQLDSLSSRSVRVTQQSDRSRGYIHTSRDRENFLTALTRIQERITRISTTPRDEFYDGSASYDAASLALIRLQALREVPEFQVMFSLLSDEESRGLLAMRNIASHSGYDTMDDDILWAVTTEQLPTLLARLRKTALEHFGSQDQTL